MGASFASCCGANTHTHTLLLTGTTVVTPSALARELVLVCWAAPAIASSPRGSCEPRCAEAPTEDCPVLT